MTSGADRVRVMAVIPAHNEENNIEQTILDLLTQTWELDAIVVVADNCTDNTVSLVQQVQGVFSNVYCLETVRNTARKAGAVNQLLYRIEDDWPDFILLMDADTRIACDAVERAVQTMLGDESLAAVCSKAGVLPLSGKAGFLGWLLHRLQRLEYAMFDSQRVQTLGRLKVIHGMAALHRWEALRQAGGYCEGNLVEDYELTLRYKELGWRVTVELSMKARTEVPINLSEWWKQRLRWNRGGVDTLREHGWNPVTRGEILRHFWINALTFVQVALTVGFFVSLFKSGTVWIHGIVLLGMILGMFDSLYRLRYLESSKLTDWIVRLVMVPEQLYSYMRIAVLYQAYILSFFGLGQSW